MSASGILGIVGVYGREKDPSDEPPIINYNTDLSIEYCAFYVQYHCAYSVRLYIYILNTPYVIKWPRSRINPAQ